MEEFGFSKTEWRYSKVLFNFMAFEGARASGFVITEDFREQANAIVEIGPPKNWNQADNCYDHLRERREDESDFEFCYRCLKKFRDNLIHCNKARNPDDQDRIDVLLHWTDQFIDAVNGSNTEFSRRVRGLKNQIGIENF